MKDDYIVLKFIVGCIQIFLIFHLLYQNIVKFWTFRQTVWDSKSYYIGQFKIFCTPVQQGGDHLGHLNLLVQTSIYIYIFITDIFVPGNMFLKHWPLHCVLLAINHQIAVCVTKIHLGEILSDSFNWLTTLIKK